MAGGQRVAFLILDDSAGLDRSHRGLLLVLVSYSELIVNFFNFFVKRLVSELRLSVRFFHVMFWIMVQEGV